MKIWLNSPRLTLILIFTIALSLRLYGLNWDQGFHLHPDERMIVMVTERISVPESNIFSPDSSLNPKFFAYGSLPIYLLKFTAYLLSPIFPSITSYEEINLLGRAISAIFDSLTILVIYKIAYSIFNNVKKSLLTCLIYALSILPIQLSHFYAVDTLLTFFIYFTISQLINYFQKHRLSSLIFAGVGFGLSLATKVSATVLVASLVTSLFVGILLSVRNQMFSHSKKLSQQIMLSVWHFLNPKKIHYGRFQKVITILALLTLTLFVSVIVFVIFEPFALTDFATFKQQILEQQAMTKDAFVFPYTLQYVNTAPYLYPLKNIFLWGLGPILGLLSFLGGIIFLIKLVKGLQSPGNEKSEGAQLILLSFYFAYFIVVGGFAVKFMRYCLPLYPVFAIFATELFFYLKSKLLRVSLLTLQLLTVMAFMNIYNLPHTRVAATQWLNKNVAVGSTLLVEHWDDSLPLGYPEGITQLSLPLYDSDFDPSKWTNINKMLEKGDYIILASNRLYTPLQKLTDCNNLPSNRCYPLTTSYYQNLFAGKLGYSKVAEFTNYPNLFGLYIDDQSADESFTVYDHPKVTIFKKNR